MLTNDHGDDNDSYEKVCNVGINVVMGMIILLIMSVMMKMVMMIVNTYSGKYDQSNVLLFPIY